MKKDKDIESAGSVADREALTLRFAPALDGLLPAAIEFNYEQLKSELAEWTGRYSGLVVEADGLKGAKADRAALNKARERLEEARREVKRRCLAPYDAFELKVRELVGLIDAPMREIDSQLARYEQERRAKKRSDVERAWDEAVGDLAGVLSLEAVLDDRWLNATVTMTEVAGNMNALVSRVRNDLAAIGLSAVGMADAARSRYLEFGLDLAATLRWIDAEKRRLAALAARAAVEERNAAAGAVRPSPVPAEPANAPNVAGSGVGGNGDAVPIPSPVATDDDRVVSYRIEVRGRRSALSAMRLWMAEHGVEYTKL